MYNYRYKDHRNLGQNIPIENIPMPMENIPMTNMPAMNMPMYDEDLKSMYPKTYMRIYPMVRHHCDMLESMHGTMYCPSKGEMDNVSKDICDMYEKHHKDDDDDDDDRNNINDPRQILGQGRRGITQDLIRILLIRDLLGRRRRRRRMYHHGY